MRQGFTRLIAVSLAAGVVSLGMETGQAQEALVPPVMQFSGVLQDSAGRPLTGVQGVTFALYREQEGGSPL